MSGPILRAKRLKILEPLQEADADEILVRNSVTKEVSSLPKESVFDADNIKTEIAIDAPVDPTAEGFADAINALPIFTIDGKTIPTFKAVTTGENPVVYYVELLNLGKGSYGLTGTQLSIDNLKITTVEPTSKDIADLSSTQIIDLGNQGDDVVTAMNRQMPNITIQDQNEGYTIVKGIFLNGQFHEYLWIGTAGTYGRDVLQTTDQDFKELSSVSQGVARATDNYSGTVKTDVYKENPTVYVKETVDNLLNGKANTFTEIKTITGIAYTPILSDVTKELLYEGTLPMNITIPNNSTEPFPAGTSFYTLGTNTGIVTASAAAGVVLKYKAGMSLSAVQNEIRKYTKQGVNTWLIDGSVAAPSAKVPYTAYINTVSGNNATASLGDATKPYATDAAAYAALPSDDGNAWNFIFLCDNVTRVLGSTSFSRRIKYVCYNTGTFNFSNFTISGVYKELYFDMPLCTLYHAGVVDYTDLSTGISRDSFFNVKKLWIESTFLLSNGHGLGSKFLIGTFYQRNTSNAFFTSGTVRIGLFDSTAGNMVSNGANLDISINELSLKNNNHNISLENGKTIPNPIKKFSGTGTYTTSSISDFSVTNVETSAGTTLKLAAVTWLKGKTNSSFLGTIKGCPEDVSNIINFNGRFVPASGFDTYGVSLNIINSNVIISGALISSANFAWPTRTVVIKNSTFLQDAPQALFQGFNSATNLTIEKHGSLHTNGTIGDNGANITIVNKTQNSF